MPNSEETNYYYTAGWKRFELNRRKMLSNYDLAKFENADRPLQTEHGVIAEAHLRKWLREFLPERYGVTSGFIIPPILEPENYTEYHYDVILYDKLDSPVIWEGGNFDSSFNGQRRAIPAGRVKAVFEVKANLNSRTAKEVKEKINELNSIRTYFPRHFFAGAIFFELQKGKEKWPSFLKNLIPDGNEAVLDLGCVLRCNSNKDVSGIIQKFSSRASDVENSRVLFRDIDDYCIQREPNGQIANNSNFPSIGIFNLNSRNENQQHFYKKFICSIGKNFNNSERGLSIEWSRNGFALFILSILSRFNSGTDFRNEVRGGFPFGLCFDKVQEIDSKNNN